MLVSCVHPVAILRAVFCTICSVSMFVSDTLDDHIVEAYSSTCLVMALYIVEAYSSTCLVMALYVASMVSLCLPHLIEVRTFEYVDCFACFGCCQVYVSVVCEFGVKCES